MRRGLKCNGSSLRSTTISVRVPSNYAPTQYKRTPKSLALERETERERERTLPLGSNVVRRIQRQGDKTEGQMLLGLENRRTGELWGLFCVALGGSWGDFGGSEGGQRGVGGGTWRSIFFHFLEF